MKTLYIYIPCYRDYELALIIAKNIRDQELVLRDKIRIVISISINGVFLSESEINNFSQVADNVEYTSQSIGADINIAKGFLKALEYQPDYFWIVSANENITNSAIANLIEMIENNPEVDFFIANVARSGVATYRNIFIDFPTYNDTSIGLITSTIYNYKSTSNHFFIANKFSWTGWSQLAVIQHKISSVATVNVYEFLDSEIYNKPYLFLESTESNISEIVSARYHHSFFGLPILAEYFLKPGTHEMRVFLVKWFQHNWFRIYFYHSSTKLLDMSTQLTNDREWIELQFFNIFKNSRKFLFLIIKFLFVLRLEPLYSNTLAKKLLLKYKIKSKIPIH